MSQRCVVFRQGQQASPWTKRLAIGLPILIGSIIALLIVLSLAGKIQPVETPAKYLTILFGKSG